MEIRLVNWQKPQAEKPTHKVCTKCNTKKEIGEFHVARTKRDGHSSVCIPCTKERAAATDARKREGEIPTFIF